MLSFTQAALFPKYDRIYAITMFFRRLKGVHIMANKKKALGHYIFLSQYDKSKLPDKSKYSNPVEYAEAIVESFDEHAQWSFVEEDSSGYGPTDGTSALNYTTDGSYTIKDYYALPDEMYVELIDGLFYDKNAPSTRHQRISILLAFEFENYIRNNNGSCIPLTAPLDVQLDCDDDTMLLPDLVIVCDRDKIHEDLIFGAPDLVVEIISPSSRYHDSVRKLRKYREAGVREYWLIDPVKKKVLVYFFERSEEGTEYDFTSTIPVNIWDGKCIIDFNYINEKISFMSGS